MAHIPKWCPFMAIAHGLTTMEGSTALEALEPDCIEGGCQMWIGKPGFDLKEQKCVDRGECGLKHPAIATGGVVEGRRGPI